jgi:hypothetical protein
MLILDDMFFFPASGVFRMFREIYHAALREQPTEAERIASELMDLHGMLDAGEITRPHFDEQQKELLGRLEKLGKQLMRNRSGD